MKDKNIPKTNSPRLEERISAQVRRLRDERGLSLDQLSQSCGVSRSMLSLIERAEASPTATVLEKIATGLGVALASLFEPTAVEPSSIQVLARASKQETWRDPASGYTRRNVSPPHELGGEAAPVQIVEVKFPAQARVMYEGAIRSAQGVQVHQQIWLLAGQMQITLGNAVFDLKAGDCLAHRLDRPITYHNPGTQTARYAVVISKS
ncbi:MAG: helix-turn-helix transcriptional regulator [Brachymonas sp.]|nr:helix-turn-helix transcriptional regulator [Brachymonas sp.]